MSQLFEWGDQSTGISALASFLHLIHAKLIFMQVFFLTFQILLKLDPVYTVPFAFSCWKSTKLALNLNM